MSLLSAVITFKAQNGAADLPYLGRSMQGWLLHEISQRLPGLGDALHPRTQADADNDHDSSPEKFRPYTLSTLMKADRPALQVAPGEICWVRLTTLASALNGMPAEFDLCRWIQTTFLPDLAGKPIEIGPLELTVDNWSADSAAHPLAGQTEYAELIRQAMLSRAVQFTFAFDSATSFSQGGNDLPLPLPDLIFKSWFERFEIFAPDHYYHLDLLAFVQNCVVLSDYRIRPVKVASGKRGWEGSPGFNTGFMGEVTFHLRRVGPRSPFYHLWDHGADLVRMLARYAFYCGTGRRTAAGLGQTRLVSEVGR